jgi:hypothetical protein
MQAKTPAAKRKRAASVPIVPAKRSAYPPPPAVYALRVWSVKTVNGKWYVSQAARFDDKEQWMGPYATVYRATTAIARKLAEESCYTNNATLKLWTALAPTEHSQPTASLPRAQSREAPY